MCGLRYGWVVVAAQKTAPPTVFPDSVFACAFLEPRPVAISVVSLAKKIRLGVFPKIRLQAF